MDYHDEVFDRVTVRLDGNRFFECTFVDCDIRYAGGDFTIRPLEFAPGTQITFEGAAQSAVDLWKRIQILGAESVPIGSWVNFGDAWFRKSEKPAGAP